MPTQLITVTKRAVAYVRRSTDRKNSRLPTSDQRLMPMRPSAVSSSYAITSMMPSPAAPPKSAPPLWR